jgi:probable rRNA maturation factor
MNAPAAARRARPLVVDAVDAPAHTGAPSLSLAQARRLLRALAGRLRVPHDSMAVALGDDALLRGLNRRFRGKDRVTDVLSFPAGEDPTAGGFLGDIAISCDAARRQARRRGHSAAQETRILLLHGLLHLLGYDHVTDDGQMEMLGAGGGRA